MAKVTYRNNVSGKNHTVEKEVFDRMVQRTPGRYTLLSNATAPNDVIAKEQEITNNTSKKEETKK